MSEVSSSTKKGASFIAKGMIVHGNVNGEGDMRLSGNIQGEITLKTGTLNIEESGFVDGNIKVKKLVVAGWVKGEVTTGEYVELAATGKVEGDVKTPCLRVEKGAILNGNFEVTRN